MPAPALPPLETPADAGRLIVRAAGLLAAVFVLQATVRIVAGYADYLPPDFHRGFLVGRGAYFHTLYGGLYRAAFYVHIAAGPLTLLLAVALMAGPVRRRWPHAHRRLGRAQAALVLLAIAPSGLVMATRAAGGPLVSASLAALAVATALTVWLGVRTARARQMATHRRWMTRCTLLLVSAIVLRLLGGLGGLLPLSRPWADWYDPAISWASWTLPLAAYELTRLRHSMIRERLR